MTLFATLVAAAIVTGVLAGSLLTEAMVLAPHWRTLQPKQFVELYATLGPKLQTYFAPLTITAVVLPTVAAIYSVATGADAAVFSVLCDGLILAVLAIYFYYFKSANAGFLSPSPNLESLPAELRRWQRWNWIRTVMATAAFLFALLALL